MARHASAGAAAAEVPSRTSCGIIFGETPSAADRMPRTTIPDPSLLVDGAVLEHKSKPPHFVSWARFDFSAAADGDFLRPGPPGRRTIW